MPLGRESNPRCGSVDTAARMLASDATHLQATLLVLAAFMLPLDREEAARDEQ